MQHISRIVLVSLLFSAVLLIFSFAVTKAHAQLAATPTLFCLGNESCAYETSPSPSVVTSVTLGPTTDETTTEPTITGSTSEPTTTIAPCESTESTVSVQHHHHHHHRKHSFSDFLKFLIDLINRLIEQLGGNEGTIPTPTDPCISPEPTQGEEPTAEPTTGNITTAPTGVTTVPAPTSGPSIGAAPADPAANATIKNLLSRINQYKGKFLLSGQMDGDQGQDQQAALAARNGGVYAAIHGYDWAVGGVTAGNAATYLNKMISEWNQYKVIPTVSQHWTPNSATETPPGCGVIKNSVSMTDVMNPSTAVGARYAAWKKNVGDDFQTLSAAGVPVLFRPFHEAGNSCFWWDEGTPADYVALWKDTFNYLTTTRGLHNILWVFNSNGPNVNKAFYPGDSFVDIIGGDNYTVTNGDFTNDYKGYQAFSANKPVALPEVASVPDLSKFSSYPVAYEMTWSGSFLAQANTDAQLKTFFADPRVINRSNVSKFLDGSL